MRLIDANELEIELTKQKAHLMDKSYHTTIEFDRMMYINTATGLIHAINILHNAPTVEPEPYFEKAEKDKRIYERGFEDGQNARPQGKCRTCRHRDPEDKKCDCGGKERQGCPFPVSDDYFCKFYEKGGTE